MKEDKALIVNVDEDSKDYITKVKKELGLKNTKEVIKLLIAVSKDAREALRPDDNGILLPVDIFPEYASEMGLEKMKSLLPKEKTKAILSHSDAKEEQSEDEDDSLPEEEEEFETVVEVGV